MSIGAGGRPIHPSLTFTMARSRITFWDAPFIRTHHRSPRGRGSWAFVPTIYHGSPIELEHTVLSPSMTYTEARKWARQHFASIASEVGGLVLVVLG